MRTHYPDRQVVKEDPELNVLSQEFPDRPVGDMIDRS